MKQERLPFFTSDTHFGHANIILYADRPFKTHIPVPPSLTNVSQIIWMKGMEKNPNHKIGEDGELYILHPDQMDEVLIDNWNAVVGTDDIVYHLGDIFLCTVERAKYILGRLNGTVRLIRGNHEKTAEQVWNYRGDNGKSKIEWIKDYYELKVPDNDAREKTQKIVLLHYAMRVWNKSHHGAWQLYGHSHGSLEDPSDSKQFDVGVDCHDYKPLSYQQVKDIMATKTFKPVDHHTGGRY